MGRLAGFKYSEVARKLRKLGWDFDRQAAGSHEIWRNNQKSNNRVVTIPRHTGDMAEGTLRAILRQAEIEVEDFLNA